MVFAYGQFRKPQERNSSFGGKGGLHGDNYISLSSTASAPPWPSACYPGHFANEVRRSFLTRIHWLFLCRWRLSCTRSMHPDSLLGISSICAQERLSTVDLLDAQLPYSSLASIIIVRLHSSISGDSTSLPCPRNLDSHIRQFVAQLIDMAAIV